MPASTITSKRQTTIPKEVCDALDVGPGDKITWEVKGGRVAVTTQRPLLWELEGFIQTRRAGCGEGGRCGTQDAKAHLTGLVPFF